MKRNWIWQNCPPSLFDISSSVVEHNNVALEHNVPLEQNKHPILRETGYGRIVRHLGSTFIHQPQNIIQYVLDQKQPFAFKRKWLQRTPVLYILVELMTKMKLCVSAISYMIRHLNYSLVCCERITIAANLPHSCA